MGILASGVVNDTRSVDPHPQCFLYFSLFSLLLLSYEKKLGGFNWYFFSFAGIYFSSFHLCIRLFRHWNGKEANQSRFYFFLSPKSTKLAFFTINVVGILHFFFIRLREHVLWAIFMWSYFLFTISHSSTFGVFFFHFFSKFFSIRVTPSEVYHAVFFSFGHKCRVKKILPL